MTNQYVALGTTEITGNVRKITPFQNLRQADISKIPGADRYSVYHMGRDARGWDLELQDVGSESDLDTILALFNDAAEDSFFYPYTSAKGARIALASAWESEVGFWPDKSLWRAKGKIHSQIAALFGAPTNYTTSLGMTTSITPAGTIAAPLDSISIIGLNSGTNIIAVQNPTTHSYQYTTSWAQHSTTDMKRVCWDYNTLVYGIDASDQVVRRSGSSWVVIGTGYKEIAARTSTEIYGIKISDSKIYKYNGSSWTEYISEISSDLSVGVDGCVAFIKSNEIFRYYNGVLESLGGATFIKVSCSKFDEIIAINAAGGSWRWVVDTWVNISSTVMIDISLGRKGDIIGLTSDGITRHWNGSSWDAVGAELSTNIEIFQWLDSRSHLMEPTLKLYDSSNVLLESLKLSDRVLWEEILTLDYRGKITQVLSENLSTSTYWYYNAVNNGCTWGSSKITVGNECSFYYLLKGPWPLSKNVVISADIVISAGSPVIEYSFDATNWEIAYSGTELTDTNEFIIPNTRGRGDVYIRFRSTSSNYATLTTALSGANNDLVFTAKKSGSSGNLVSLTYSNPGGTGGLSIGVSGNDITVTLARSGGVISSTAIDVADALWSSIEAMALLSDITMAGTDNGTGVVTAMAHTHLAGGTTTASMTVENIVISQERKIPEVELPVLPLGATSKVAIDDGLISSSRGTISFTYRDRYAI